jgi:hypothetical protein
MPTRRYEGVQKKNASNNNPISSAESHKSLTQAESLKRVFKWMFQSVAFVGVSSAHSLHRKF